MYLHTEKNGRLHQMLVDTLVGKITSDFFFPFLFFCLSEIFTMGMHDFNNQNFQQNLKVYRKDPSAFRLVEIKYESLKK